MLSLNTHGRCLITLSICILIFPPLLMTFIYLLLLNQLILFGMIQNQVLLLSKILIYPILILLFFLIHRGLKTYGNLISHWKCRWLFKGFTIIFYCSLCGKIMKLHLIFSSNIYIFSYIVISCMLCWKHILVYLTLSLFC